jgi:hypothetical protein
MKTKEKKVLEINYQGSGIKTLNGFGVFFFILGAIAIFVALIGGCIYLNNIGSYISDKKDALVGASLAGTFFPLGIYLLAAGAVCIGLSSIAKTALFKRAVLESEYEFLSEGEMEQFPESNNVDIATDDGDVSPKGWAEGITEGQKRSAERLIPKMYPNQVIVYVCSKNKMEIWNISFWEEEKNNPKYKLIYKN